MDKQVLVYADLQGTPHLAGRLWARMRKDRESATFEYDKTWLTNPDHFSLEPALKLGPGPFHTPSDKPLFGAIGDSAPDRWGQVLMRRAERRRAEHAGQTPRTVGEIDYCSRWTTRRVKVPCVLRSAKGDRSWPYTVRRKFLP